VDPSQPAGSRRRTTAIIAAAGLACLAIAIPVSGAFGAGAAAGLRPTARCRRAGPAAARRARRQLPEGRGRRPIPGQPGRQLGSGPAGRLARVV